MRPWRDAIAPLGDRCAQAPPETRRVIHEVVRNDGETAVALGIDDTDYSDPPERGMPEHEVRTWCATFPRGERRATAECLALDDVDTMKIADTEARARLYEPGDPRLACREWFSRFGIDTDEHRAGMSDATARFLVKWRSGDLVRVMYRIDNTRGPHHSTSGSILMRFDHEADAYHAVSFNDYSTHNQAEYASLVLIEGLTPERNGYRIIPTPKALTKWRDGAIAPALDQGPPIIGKREDDALLYFQQESLPHADSPFVMIDPGELDEDARRLQQQMLTLFLAEDGAVSFERCLGVWHPDAHKTLRMQRAAREQDPDPWKGYSFFTYGGGTPATETALIRLVARVRWDDGAVWYGWVPRRPSRLPDRMMRILEERADFAEHIEQADQQPDRIVLIRQRRCPDGVFRLAMRVMPGAEPAHLVAMRAMSDSAVAEAIVREHRCDAPVVGEPTLDR